jgi:hypothetical protein
MLARPSSGLTELVPKVAIRRGLAIYCQVVFMKGMPVAVTSLKPGFTGDATKVDLHRAAE